MNISSCLSTFADMYKIVKPLFFTLNPESAHHFVTGGLTTFNKIWGAKKLLKGIYTVEDKRLDTEITIIRMMKIIV